MRIRLGDEIISFGKQKAGFSVFTSECGKYQYVGMFGTLIRVSTGERITEGFEVEEI